MSSEMNRRILLVDDNGAIHEDFRKILCPKERDNAALADAKAAFFGTTTAKRVGPTFVLESAYQGEEALVKVRASMHEGKPFALAFVDVRMPPGWDGIETILQLWKEDPNLHCVICTAYADYSWDEMLDKLGRSDRLLILKKPFDPVEVQQIASALTEKWHAEQLVKQRMLEARNAEQEARSYASSVATMNRALEHARTAAIAAAQAKSEFLANMSHEIRTPMIAILGAAELLREPNLGEGEHSEHLDSIRSEGSHLLAMLGDILDIASIEAGRLNVELKSCAPRTILEEVRLRFAERAEAKGLTFQANCAVDVPDRIRSDPARLRQILHHLVSNAIKFTEEGRVTIELTQPSGSTRVQFSVIDTGVGITPDQRRRLFEAFAQADGSLTRRHGGAGLGLALSRRLAQTLGGELDVTSEPGRGSRFMLTLEIGDTAQESSLSTGTSYIFGVADAAPLRGRILLVEDVAATQRLYALYLRRAGAEVDVADNGQIAVERALKAQRDGRSYDLVLMDMQMPVLDGYSATRELRQNGYKGPIIAVTAHALAGDREKCLEAGCDDYCAKPTDRERLVVISREWIQRSVPAPLPKGPQPSDVPTNVSATRSQLE